MRFGATVADVSLKRFYAAGELPRTILWNDRGELADLASAGLDSLNERARHAFQAELRKRGLTLADLNEQCPQETLVDETETYKGSLLKGFGAFPGIPIGAVLVGVLYAAYLKNLPYGFEAAGLLMYSGLVFVLLFCGTGKTQGYDLRQKAVRRHLPRLVAVHLVFLVIFLIVVTVGPSLRSSVPDSWLVKSGRRNMSPFEGLGVLSVTVVGAIEVWISRKILRRSS